MIINRNSCTISISICQTFDNTTRFNFSLNMSMRAAPKVPKYGLFYFPSDSTTSIVPLKNITKVITGSNVTTGSMVVVQFNRVAVESKIIDVNGTY